MIAEPYRRRGIGQQVMGQIEAEIRKNRLVRTILTAVQVNNPQALRFWQKLGYRIFSGPEAQTDSTVTFRMQKVIRNENI